MGFAAEMKDFNTAVAQGQKMVGAVDDRAYNQTKKDYLAAQTETINQKNNDTEGQAADLAGKQAKVGATNASAAANNEWVRQSQENSAVAAQQRQQQLAADKAVTDAQAGAVSAGAPQRPAPIAVVPAGVPAVVPPGAVPAMSGGGSVQKFAGGGAVGDEPAPEPEPEPAPADDEPAPQQGAVPADGEGESDTTDISARRRGFSGQAGSDAVRAGLTYGAQLHGLHTPSGVDTPGRQRSAKDHASGVGAAPAEDMDKLRKQVDPEGKLGESEANLAALGAVYQFKMKRGDTDGAAKTAWQMLQYHRQASQRYAVIAAHAADSGDLDTATHAAMKAYANVPDGKDVKFQKTPDGQISYTYTDSKTGKVMSQGIESPDKLAAAAMGFAEKGFDQSLLSSITQQPAAAAKPAVDPDTVPLKTPDKKAALAQIDSAYDDQNPDDEKTKAAKYSAEDKRLYKGAAYRIAVHTHNSRLTPEEAMDITTKIADPTLTGEKDGFSTKKVAGGYEVSIGKRPPVHVPAADFDALMEKRSAAIEAKKKAAEEAAKPGMGASIAAVADSALTGVKGYLAKNKAKAEATIAARDAKAKAAPPAAPDYSTPQP
jgi:hypothetical protein